MKYEPILPVAKEQADSAFQGDSPEEIVHALLGVAEYESDWEWVEQRCLSFIDSPFPDVRNTAITCLGHLARTHRKLNKPKVLAALTKIRADPACAGRAEDAIEDVEMFIQ